MDTLAYFGGRRFGKRKFLPNISPNKTIEGFLIAIALVPIIYSALFSFNSNISIFILFSLFFLTSLFSFLKYDLNLDNYVRENLGNTSVRLSKNIFRRDFDSECSSTGI